MPDFPSRPLILGHRGAPRELPENTLESCRLAVRQGADGVEVDVQPSIDGVPVLIHDPTLARTTGHGGHVAALPWARIAQLRAGSEPVPRLDDVAAWAAETDAWVNVEIKSPGAEEAAVAAMMAAGRQERTVFSSFYPAILSRVRQIAPHAARFFLTEWWDDDVRAAVESLGVQGVCPHHRLATSAFLDEMRAAGLGVIVWTVDEPERIRELVRANVTAIISNLPALAAGILREERG
ncbi:MAG TPA: glycerophosphodiester phosphodiesterase [Longimicrobium sp.]|jgi:glycerophosphoryl diester phosphodiesterase|uniref:glycerophosphodiester phosphodiesterase n=1 Tax=Longimicrobium sp. TaxID=2029185 RepID=UPI002EDA3FA8